MSDDGLLRCALVAGGRAAPARDAAKATVRSGPAAALRRRALRTVCISFLVVGSLHQLHAQGAGAPGAGSPRTASRSPSDAGSRWQDLKPAQQAALKPLEREWSSISPSQRLKWIELSGRFARMTPTQQARIQERMTGWAELSPEARSQARLRFEEARQVPATDRRARWDAYQALTPQQREQLAERAAPPAPPRRGGAPTRPDRPGREQPQAKSNIVPNPSFAAPPRAIAPTIVQARPGATTTPITRRPTPPLHQQTGLPKIAATPGFVDKSTLLPQRGPQGAAVRPTPRATPDRPARE